MARRFRSRGLLCLQTFKKLFQEKFKSEDKEEAKLTNIKVGLIGAGMVGKLLLNSILTFKNSSINYKNIFVSTRRPEKLINYEQLGINIFFNNETLIDQCDVIFLCFPPSLDNWAVLELKDAINRRFADKKKQLKPLLISLISNLTVYKLESSIHLPNIFLKTWISQPLIEKQMPDYIVLLNYLNKHLSTLEGKQKSQFLLQEDSEQLQSFNLMVVDHLFTDIQQIKQTMEVFDHIFNSVEINKQAYSIFSSDANVQKLLFATTLKEEEAEKENLKRLFLQVYNKKEQKYRADLRAAFSQTGKEPEARSQ